MLTKGNTDGQQFESDKQNVDVALSPGENSARRP